MSMTDADGWYEELMNGHRELTDDQSARLNCALVLLLAERVADQEQLRHCLAEARAAALHERDLLMDAVLDAGRLRGQSLLVCVCTFSVMILDGFDIQIIGFAAPALVAEFGIERSALGLALAASVLGMSLGAMAVGRIGDRFGRRPALLLSTVLFGATTLLGATANDVTSLAAWRFLTGLGLGGALPSAVALMAEFAPAQRSQPADRRIAAGGPHRRHPGIGAGRRAGAGVRLARHLHRRRPVAPDRGGSAPAAAAGITALPRGARGSQASCER